VKRPRIVAAVGGFTARGAAASDAEARRRRAAKKRTASAVGKATGVGAASAEGAAELRGEAMRWLAPVAKWSNRKNKGGRPATDNRERDKLLAGEFLAAQKKQPKHTTRAARRSDTDLMIVVGQRHGLSRSTAIRIIKAGLKALFQKG
jgi:hypothetical protein